MKTSINNINVANYCRYKNTYTEKISFTKRNITASAPLPKTYRNCVPFNFFKKTVSRVRRSSLHPIKTKEEYNRLLAEILGYIESGDNEHNLKYISLYGYENTPCELLGLIEYCGTRDRSNQINKWLSGRKKVEPVLKDKQMAKIIRVFEYSLKKLDESFGKYKGIVYRAGYFNPNTDKQFYSSSFSPLCAVRHAKNPIPDKTNPYSIIKVKNGHNIFDFQKSINTKTSKIFAMAEKEILLDRNSKFKLIPKDEYTHEDYELKINFLADCISTPTDNIRKAMAKKSSLPMFENITIWEEV